MLEHGVHFFIIGYPQSEDPFTHSSRQHRVGPAGPAGPAGMAYTAGPASMIYRGISIPVDSGIQTAMRMGVDYE